MENRFWQPLKDKGLMMVAVDANGDAMDGLMSYLDHIPQTYPIGLEDTLTPTYKALTASYKGLNPFPVDVVVGKDGKIAYVGREYDPDSIKSVVDKLMAE